MKYHNISQTTDNNKEYKFTTRTYKLRCPYCKPHQGCNKTSHWRKRSWKNYRKTQYKDIL